MMKKLIEILIVLFLLVQVILVVVPPVNNWYLLRNAKFEFLNFVDHDNPKDFTGPFIIKQNVFKVDCYWKGLYWNGYEGQKDSIYVYVNSNSFLLWPNQSSANSPPANKKN